MTLESWGSSDEKCRIEKQQGIFYLPISLCESNNHIERCSLSGVSCPGQVPVLFQQSGARHQDHPWSRKVGLPVLEENYHSLVWSRNYETKALQDPVFVLRVHSTSQDFDYTPNLDSQQRNRIYGCWQEWLTFNLIRYTSSIRFVNSMPSVSVASRTWIISLSWSRCLSVRTCEASGVRVHLLGRLIHAYHILKRRYRPLKTLANSMHIGHHSQEFVLYSSL